MMVFNRPAATRNRRPKPIKSPPLYGWWFFSWVGIWVCVISWRINRVKTIFALLPSWVIVVISVAVGFTESFPLIVKILLYAMSADVIIAGIRALHERKLSSWLAYS